MPGWSWDSELDSRMHAGSAIPWMRGRRFGSAPGELSKVEVIVGQDRNRARTKRMKRIRTAIILWMAILGLPAATHAQLAQSTFATGAEGWLSVTLPYPHAIPVTLIATNAPQWQGGGHVRLEDPDGSGATGNVQYWMAPALFLGAKGEAYGGTLSFDLRNQGSGFGPFSQEDVILVGGGLVLVYQLTNAPAANAFTHYVVPLSDSGWRRDSLTGPAATAMELESVLSALSKLFIRAEFQLGPDTEFLDNVQLCSGARLAVRTVGTHVVLSWPQAACNAVLERSDVLGSPAVWSPEGSPQTAVGSDYVVTTPVAEGPRFYRLRFP